MPPHSILRTPSSSTSSSVSDASRAPPKRVTFADLLTRTHQSPTKPGARPLVTSHPVWQPLAHPLPRVVYNVCPDLAPRVPAPVRKSADPAVCNKCGERLPARPALRDVNGRRPAHAHPRKPHADDARIKHLRLYGAMPTMKRYIASSLKLDAGQSVMLDVVGDDVVYRMYVACWEIRAADDVDGLSVSLRRMEVKKMMLDEARELEALMKEKMVRMDRIESGRWQADKKRIVRNGTFHLRKFLANELSADVEDVAMLSQEDLEEVVLAVVEERVRKVREQEREKAIFEQSLRANGNGQDANENQRNDNALLHQQFVQGYAAQYAGVAQPFITQQQHAPFVGIPAGFAPMAAHAHTHAPVHAHVAASPVVLPNMRPMTGAFGGGTL